MMMHPPIYTKDTVQCSRTQVPCLFNGASVVADIHIDNTNLHKQRVKYNKKRDTDT